MAFTNYFLVLDNHKSRLCSDRESYVSNGCQGLGTHFLPLTRTKCDLGEVEKDMFHVLACHFELIFRLLTIPKCDLVEVEKPVLNELESHLQLNFGLWNSQKWDYGEFKNSTLLELPTASSFSAS